MLEKLLLDVVESLEEFQRATDRLQHKIAIFTNVDKEAYYKEIKKGKVGRLTKILVDNSLTDLNTIYRINIFLSKQKTALASIKNFPIANAINELQEFLSGLKQRAEHFVTDFKGEYLNIYNAFEKELAATIELLKQAIVKGNDENCVKLIEANTQSAPSQHAAATSIKAVIVPLNQKEIEQAAFSKQTSAVIEKQRGHSPTDFFSMLEETAVFNSKNCNEQSYQQAALKK